MASLLAKDAYLQSLARRICAQPSQEPLTRKPAGKLRGSGVVGPPKKKREKAQKKSQEQEVKAVETKAKALGKKSPAASRARKPGTAKEEEASSSTGAPADGLATEPDSFFALDVLRQRLHEKIQEARGQVLAELSLARMEKSVGKSRAGHVISRIVLWSNLGSTRELSPATLEKRRRRRQERDRRKRKRKELQAKAKVAAAVEAAQPPPEAPREEQQPQPGLLSTREEPPALSVNWAHSAWGGAWEATVNLGCCSSPEVEVGEEAPASKAQRRREKRRKLKGHLAPLTGRNYRQLLERLQARQDQLEELRQQDEGRARELEAKLRWTDQLYKAEGVRVRDDEHLLQRALRRKEKRRAQRQRRWEKRAAHVVEKMQRRQDQRRQNLRRKQAARTEQRLERARKKGRVLPQDLERAGLV
ncbi:hypothetical protein MC885_007082 [Smutsia gigantea]|nr:hypothetical protein MC885_007082 [Smutsia gigantea]